MNLNKIKGLCREKGITLRTLEELAGLGTNSIYRWEENNPSVDKVKNVADVLGVTIEELLKEED